jgi:hypothetical protein
MKIVQAIISVSLILAACWYLYDTQKKCDDAGGTLVQGVFKPECIK